MPADKNDLKIQALRNAEIRRLRELPDAPLDLADQDRGVLLSDRIRYYCTQYRLITDPFKDENIRPAGYDLTVGAKYAINGQSPKTLNEGGFFVIPPYQVAIVQIRETLNLPKFLIGRWNIRVKRAYEGLLWVGGAQVNPGFRGHLCCPIYNLSNKEVRLEFGDTLAMIDFVVTTPFKEWESQPYFKWDERKWIVFEEYDYTLESGVQDKLTNVDLQLEKARTDTKGRLAEFRERMDTFVSLVFVVVSVLFAGLGVVATKGSDEPSFLSSPVWTAAIALYFALRAYFACYRTRQITGPEGKSYSRLDSRLIEMIVCTILFFAFLAFHFSHARVAAREIQTASTKASLTAQALNEEKRNMDIQLRALRAEADAKISALQQQINSLQQGSGSSR